MSVMSAGINSLTTATTVDFYQRVFLPGHSPEHYATVGRIGTLAWGLVVTLLALGAGRLGELALAYNRVSSVVSGPLPGIFLLGILTRQATARGSLLGAAAGMAAVGLASLRTEWSFFYFGPIGVLTTITAGYLASLLTRPPKPEKVHGLVLGGP